MLQSVPGIVFEFDQAKGDANKRKHGIDFLEAQALWQDADQLQIAQEPATRLVSWLSA